MVTLQHKANIHHSKVITHIMLGFYHNSKLELQCKDQVTMVTLNCHNTDSQSYVTPYFDLWECVQNYENVYRMCTIHMCYTLMVFDNVWFFYFAGANQWCSDPSNVIRRGKCTVAVFLSNSLANLSPYTSKSTVYSYLFRVPLSCFRGISRTFEVFWL